MIFVHITEPEAINVGDVITFNPSQDSDAYLTHRVTEKLENFEGTGVTCFRTQGDANNAEDSFLIDGGRVVGVVQFGIPALGYIVRFIQLRWYFVVPVVIMIAVFFQLLKHYFLLGKDEDEEDEDNKDSSEGTKAEKTSNSDTEKASEAAKDENNKEPPSEPAIKADKDEKTESGPEEKVSEKKGS